MSAMVATLRQEFAMTQAGGSHRAPVCGTLGARALVVHNIRNVSQPKLGHVTVTVRADLISNLRAHNICDIQYSLDVPLRTPGNKCKVMKIMRKNLLLLRIWNCLAVEMRRKNHRNTIINQNAMYC